MDFNRWWSTDDRERFWLEITDRSDLGVDLNAPRVGRNGREQWHYSLIWEVRPGDVVFHYHRVGGESAIVAWSLAWGDVRDSEVVWAPHAGDRAEPILQPGWRLTLEGAHPIDRPVTFAEIRLAEGELRRIEAELIERYGRPLYTPFEMGTRAIRPKQAYLTKLPADFVGTFPRLGAPGATPLEGQGTTALDPSADLGESYREVDEGVLIADSDPFSRDPALVERSLRSHAATQNALAEFVERQGLEPRSPRPEEPNYDLAWIRHDEVFVAEVKSIHAANEERQLRLALGQVLRYRQRLRRGSSGTVVPVIATSGRPADASWESLCSGLGVMLVWPEHFDSLS